MRTSHDRLPSSKTPLFINVKIPNLSKAFFFIKLAIEFFLLSIRPLTKTSLPNRFDDTLTHVPFNFPRFKSYGLRQCEKMASITGLELERITLALTKLIYRLLQFHVKRLFKLREFDFAVPKTRRYDGVGWDVNPELWFLAMLHNILPGCVLSVADCEKPSIIKGVHVTPFEFIKSDPIAHLIPVSQTQEEEDERDINRQSKEPPLISMYALPKTLWNKELFTHYTIFTTLDFFEEFSVVNEQILEHLLEGVTFSFEVEGDAFDILVSSTDTLPSVEESRGYLTSAFCTPIPRFISLPTDVDSALRASQIPSMTSYHFDTFPSTHLSYELMLTMILVSEVFPMTIQKSHITDWHYIGKLIEARARQFLPTCQVIYVIFESNGNEMDIAKWDATSGHFYIYEEERSASTKHSLALYIGQQQHLCGREMARIRNKVYPRALFNFATMENATPLQRIFNALLNKTKALQKRKSMKTSKREWQRRKKHKSTVAHDQSQSHENFLILKGRHVDPSRMTLQPPRIVDGLLSNDVVMMKLTEFSTHIFATHKDSDSLMSTVVRTLGKMDDSIGIFRMSRLALSKHINLDPGVTVHLLDTLYPMIPLPPNTIIAYLSDGQVIVTLQPIILLPHPSSDHHYIWLHGKQESIIEGATLLRRRESSHADFFAIK